MEIKIIKGTYGQRTVNSVTKAVRVCPVHMGERVEVSDQEAARLVSRGVAAYLDEIPQDNPASDADSLGNGEKNGGAGKHPSDTDPLSTGLETPPAEDTPPEEDGDEIPEYSTDMKADQLRALMEQYDVPYKSGMNKADMVAALDEYFAQDGVEAPPDLSAAGPVE